MRRILSTLVVAGALLSAHAAGAVTVTGGHATQGSLVVEALPDGSDLRNNSADFSSVNTAYLLDEGLNPAIGDDTFLLHFDRSGGVLKTGEVKGSFNFSLAPGEVFDGVFAGFVGLLATDNLSNGVQYQRGLTGLNGAITVVRGLEPPGTNFGDILVITPNPIFNDAAATYHVRYDFTNDGATMDEVRFAFGAADAVPEPASWALMIAGFGLAGAALRRRGAVRTVA